MKTLARLSCLALALAFTACDQDPEDGIRDDAALRDFRGCAELEDYLKQAALKDMNAQIDDLIDGRFYGPIESRTGAAPTAPLATPAPAPDAYTTTNTQ